MLTVEGEIWGIPEGHIGIYDPRLSTRKKAVVFVVREK